MSVSWLWERDEAARQATLMECLDVLDGKGPKRVQRGHLACVVDWALRERCRADSLEQTLRHYCKDAARALEESLDLSSDVEPKLQIKRVTQH